MYKKMSLMRLMDLIAGGTFVTGEIFVNAEGNKITFLETTGLHWVVGENNYISTQVQITPDVLSSKWDKVKRADELTLGQAVDLLADGAVIRFVSEMNDATINDLAELELHITHRVDLQDLKDAEITRVVPERTEISARPVPIIKVSPEVEPAGEHKEPTETIDPADNKVSAGYKLDKDDVWEIHDAHFSSHVPASRLAEKYGITPRMVYYILDGTYWAEVKEQFDKYLQFRAMR